MTFVA